MSAAAGFSARSFVPQTTSVGIASDGSRSSSVRTRSGPISVSKIRAWSG
jgi:hypothetical protein